MEVLYLILTKETRTPSFKHHWKIKSLSLSHLCFADDLLIFCHGDVNSVKVIKLCLDHFSSLSGLHINDSKSRCFLSNVSPDHAEVIFNILGFQVGRFPAKFLGVPLITSKLSLANCHPLLEMVKSKISSWTNRFLSYDGRLLLIKLVVFAIQSYWSAHFILLASVFKDLKSTMSRFLWKGPSMLKFGAKVVWSKIALPYSEGGLAIKQLEDWNKALILLQLWRVVNPNSQFLWASWVRDNHLNSKHFWVLKTPNDCSWIWRKVLQLRSLAIKYIHFHIGNGESTSLWFDLWLNTNPLVSSSHSSLIINSDLGPNATVSDIIRDSFWHLPSSNHNDFIVF